MNVKRKNLRQSIETDWFSFLFIGVAFEKLEKIHTLRDQRCSFGIGSLAFWDTWVSAN